MSITPYVSLFYVCLFTRNDNFSCSHRCAPSSPPQHLIVGHPHGSACVEPRSAGGEEGLGWGHRLSLITNTMANGSAVEAVASQPCDLQLTLPTGLFCLHAAHGWLHPLSVIERVGWRGGAESMANRWHCSQDSDRSPVCWPPLPPFHPLSPASLNRSSTPQPPPPPPPAPPV